MCQHDPNFTSDSICYICHRDRVAASAVDVLEQATQRREAQLSAETQDMIETTRRIWNTTDPIEY